MESVASTDISTLRIAGYIGAAGAVFWLGVALSGWGLLAYSFAGEKRHFVVAKSIYISGTGGTNTRENSTSNAYHRMPGRCDFHRQSGLAGDRQTWTDDWRRRCEFCNT